MSRRPASRRPGVDGLLLIDKPQGWTSHDVVAKVRGITGQRRAGHTGTLDPMATGLLVICLGRGTRLVEYMAGHDKRYHGEITLGIRTDTDDAEGTAVETRPVPDISQRELDALALRFTGPIAQRPPNFSAIKQGGRRAYSLARAGEDVRIPERPVEVHGLSLRTLSPTLLAIEVHCGPGTYVRSLARDIGEALGCGAHLSALRRTAVGTFTIEDAVTLEQLAAAGEGDAADALLIPIDEGLLDRDAALLGEASATTVTQGGALETDGRTGGPIRLYSAGGDFLGTGTITAEGLLRPLKILVY